MKRIAALCLLLTTISGCQGLMHELQPHRLWRMNYYEPPGRTDGVYFSVSDPLDEKPRPYQAGSAITSPPSDN